MIAAATWSRRSCGRGRRPRVAVTYSSAVTLESRSSEKTMGSPRDCNACVKASVRCAWGPSHTLMSVGPSARGRAVLDFQGCGERRGDVDQGPGRDVTRGAAEGRLD